MIERLWLLQHLTLVRLGLFFTCITYWWLGWRGLKPQGRELSAALAASWVQFGAGTLLDIQMVRLGCWAYRPMPFALSRVPIDLHLDWALLWGCLMLWLYSRWRRRWQGILSVAVYLGAWALATSAFDSAITTCLPILPHRSMQWWGADILLLLPVLGLTLWSYHSILFPPWPLGWRVWSCRLRSMLYVSSLAYLFYAYLPGVVLSLTGGWGARPLLPLGDWRVLAIAVTPSMLLGGWATLAFSDTGFGTPLPFDPPERLVTSGPYAFVRNPMQIAGLMLAALLLVAHPTRYILFYVIDMALMAAVLFHLCEQAQLQETFGADYADYTKHVRNWLPRRHPYRPAGHAASSMKEAAGR